MQKLVSVIGLGYVGLPLSICIANQGFKVIGVDSNSTKVKEINSGKSVIEDVLDIQVREVINSGFFKATTEYGESADSEIFLICVPTPLNYDGTPDLSFLMDAVIALGSIIKKNSMVIIESTVSPGTTTQKLVPILERISGLSINDLDIAFSPERVDPSNKNWTLENTPKIVAGLTLQSRTRAVGFYKNFVNDVIECESIEVAEASKLLENSFRLVNISFINEFAIFCNKLGLSVSQVISAASSKPYGFMPFYPSAGAGGHCIPVDPLYLLNSAHENGIELGLIDLANKINHEMPKHHVRRAEGKIGNLKNKRVLIVGVAYKPNVSDIRETPAESLMAELKNKGALVYWHDELVKEWNGSTSTPLNSAFDLAIIVTLHDYIEIKMLGEVPIINTKESV